MSSYLRLAKKSPLFLALCSALAAQMCIAQTNTAPTEAAPKTKQMLDPIVITANPFLDFFFGTAKPVTVLKGDALRQKRGATIGETLSGELGVQSSAFAPGAARPIIRGQDSARVRVMDNGIDSLDVSSISPDHAVPIDTFNARQIEILRGPMTLLYGSGAIGGLVNVVSDRIPQVALNTGDTTELTKNSQFEARLSDATAERSLAVAHNNWNNDKTTGWHLDGFSRSNGDIKIPVPANVDFAEGTRDGKLANSAAKSRGGAAGLTQQFGGQFSAGVSVSRLETEYGIPNPDAARIELKQTRVDVASEVLAPFAGVEKIKLRAAHNNYKHTEFEASGAAGTLFDSKASEARIELHRNASAESRDVLGLQFSNRDFSAIGEETIVPKTKTNTQSLFLVQQLLINQNKIELGGRIEQESHKPKTALPSRKFNLVSAGVSGTMPLAPQTTLFAGLNYAERAPSIEELYSNGAHIATQSFDIGAPDLRKEQSRSIEIGFARSVQGVGYASWKLNLFANQVKNFIYRVSEDSNSDGIADVVDNEGNLAADGEFLLQRTAQGAVMFRGLEAEISFKPITNVSLRAFADTVRARLDGNGAKAANLPRIAPSRVGASAQWLVGALTLGATVTAVPRARALAQLESPTAGHTRVDADIAWKLNVGAQQQLTLSLSGKNLTNREIRSHTSYLKAFAPQPGRTIIAAVNASF